MKSLSKLRSKLLELQQQYQQLLPQLLAREPLLPGSLYTLRRRCGKEGCRCTRGELHASTVLSYRGEAKPKNITPTPEHLPVIKQLTDDYRRFRKARTQLLRLHKQMLALVDQIEEGRRQQGERQFQKLRS